MSSPQTSNLKRVRSQLRGFIPLAEESTGLTTRGQHLPALLHNLSGSIPHAQFRRGSTFRWDRLHDEEAQNDTDDHSDDEDHRLTRRASHAVETLLAPQMRSQRLIGNSNPRYRWEQYWKTDDDLKKMKKPLREYYERNNYLIQQYMYIDKLLDSSIIHDLIQEYQQPDHLIKASSRVNIPDTIHEGPPTPPMPISRSLSEGHVSNGQAISKTNSDDTLSQQPNGDPTKRIKRTPKNLYRIPDEETPLIKTQSADGEIEELPVMPAYEPEEDTDSGAPIVKWAIYINFLANTVLLALKIVVTVLTSSVSVLASLVDAALDFLSTVIVWTTTYLISRRDQEKYPVGRRRLEPIGILVFSVIMITSFVQVAIEGFNHLTSGDHTIVQLTIPAVAIMAATVIIKFGCWLWCRLIPNSSVQALAQDAMTDVVFNIFSIIFPLIGYYAKVWWLDPLGGILLSFWVIFNWSQTTSTHIRNLSGAAASADERNVLLYLCMRFAWTIKKIQSIHAYHAGDKLNVEVDIVLDENTSLRDSHDLGESLQYVLESVPTVDRAFVHLDYATYNLPSHMEQQD